MQWIESVATKYHIVRIIKRVEKFNCSYRSFSAPKGGWHISYIQILCAGLVFIELKMLIYLLIGEDLSVLLVHPFIII